MSRPHDATRVESSDHPSESTLAAFLDGELGGDERSLVEAHLDECAACRRALAEAVSVLGAGVDAAAPRAVARRAATRRTRLPWRAIGVALAASIAGIVVLQRTARDAGVEGRTRDAAPRVADERIPRLAAVAPANGTRLSGRRPVFTWGSARADRYSFRLLAEDGVVIWSRETSDTMLTLPPDVGLEPGKSYFWRVDAMSAGIVASTAAQRFTVSP